MLVTASPWDRSSGLLRAEEGAQSMLSVTRVLAWLEQGPANDYTAKAMVEEVQQSTKNSNEQPRLAGL